MGGGSKSGSAAEDSSFFTAMMEDAAELCERRNAPVFTDFLDEEKQGVAISVMKQAHANYLLFGGYENAERCMLGVFPPYDEPDTELFPMNVITVEYRNVDHLDHRSVLGTLMAQGIERSCIGDILIETGRCVFFCRNTVARALLSDIRTIGGTGVKLTEGYEPPLPVAHKFKELTDTVASARLDCLVAALANTGRSEAERKITAGDVLINSVQCKKISHTVHEGEKITIRGEGKFIIDKIGDVTRKGRLMLSARKYI